MRTTISPGRCQACFAHTQCVCVCVWDDLASDAPQLRATGLPCFLKRHLESPAEHTGARFPWTRPGPACAPGSQDPAGSTSEAVCCSRPTPRPGRLVPLGRGPRRSQGAVLEPRAQTGMPTGAATAGGCPGQVGRKPGASRLLQRGRRSAVSPAVGVYVSFGDSETRF